MGSKSKRRHAQKQFNRAQNKPLPKAEETAAATTTDATLASTAPIMTAKELRKIEKAQAKQAKQAQKEKQTKDSKPKEKKPFFLIRFFKWIGRSFAEIGSELKKVHWPTFKQVVKSTGIVLGIVIAFGLVLFGIWALLGFLYDLLITM